MPVAASSIRETTHFFVGDLLLSHCLDNKPHLAEAIFGPAEDTITEHNIILYSEYL
jgi:hypothetical protein